MRHFALLLLIGCAPRVVTVAAPPPPTPTPLEYFASSSSAPAAQAGEPERPLPDPPPAPNEQVRVLDSLFPKHLDSYAKCKKPKKEPETLVEVDDLAHKNLDNGQFIPVVEARERLRPPEVDEVEIRYLVRIVNCQSVDSPLKVEASFTEYSLTPGTPADWRRPRAIRYREWTESTERYIPRMGGRD